MYILITVLVIIILSLIVSIIALILKQNKKIQSAKKSASAELFDYILKGGYEKSVKDFKQYNKLVKDGGIVFVGDSLTQNFNVYEYFKGYNVYNRGIGGDTTIGLLKRMKESIYDLKPDVVVLLIGINDFELVENSTPLTIYENICTIINEIKVHCPKTKIILESLYPIYKLPEDGIDMSCVENKDSEKIKTVNALIKDIKGVYYLDIYKKIVREDGNIIKEFTQEGLHVNTKCYEIISSLIKEKIEALRNEQEN